MKCTNGVENLLVYRRTNELVHEKIILCICAEVPISL